MRKGIEMEAIRKLLMVAAVCSLVIGMGVSLAEDSVTVVPVRPVNQENNWEKFKDGTKQAGEAVVDGTKNTARKVADGAGDVGEAVVDGSKRAGHAIAEGYDDAKDYVKEKLD